MAKPRRPIHYRGLGQAAGGASRRRQTAKIAPESGLAGVCRAALDGSGRGRLIISSPLRGCWPALAGNLLCLAGRAALLQQQQQQRRTAVS
jgi:hypothetical protein